MKHRKVLHFYALFFLFVASIALLHAAAPSITGHSIVESPSSGALSGFAVSLFLIALLFFFLAIRRFIPRDVVQRIELKPSRFENPQGDIFK